MPTVGSPLWKNEWKPKPKPTVIAIPSDDDIRAAHLLLGTGVTDPSSRVLRSMHVHFEGGSEHDVEERIDTVLGGTYVFCPCPAWKFSHGEGPSVAKTCKHADEARSHWRSVDLLPPTRWDLGR